MGTTFMCVQDLEPGETAVSKSKQHNRATAHYNGVHYVFSWIPYQDCLLRTPPNSQAQLPSSLSSTSSFRFSCHSPSLAPFFQPRSQAPPPLHHLTSGCLVRSRRTVQPEALRGTSQLACSIPPVAATTSVPAPEEEVSFVSEAPDS